MIPVAPSFSGVPTHVLDMTTILAPLFGAVLVGLFLTSTAGIVLTILLDRWQSQRHSKRAAIPAIDTATLPKAA